MFNEVGLDGLAALSRDFYVTLCANAFWFYGFIADLETGRENLEASIELALLVSAVIDYYLRND